MTQQDLTPPNLTAPPPARGFGLRELWRLVAWGLAAGGTLTLAVYAMTTPAGHERFALAIAQARETAIPSGIEPPRPLDAKEGRRLADAVKALIVDRERLLARVATLERSLDDVTASITRVEKTAQPEPSAPLQQPTPGASAAVTAPKAEDVTASVPPRVEAAPEAPATTEPAQPQPAAETPIPEPAPFAKAATSKAEFGLDLGGARTIEGLRALWNNAKRRHGMMLEGLRPIVHLRERGRPATVEMRLVAGPIPNAATAARMCATFAAAGALCQPAPFDGQRLAVR